MRRADNLSTFICRLSGNMGDSNSWNSQGLSRPVQGWLYLPLRNRPMCVVTNRTAFFSSLVSRLPGMLLRYCVNDFEVVQVHITFVFTCFKLPNECTISLFYNNIYEGWNFNSGNYLFTTDTKYE